MRANDPTATNGVIVNRLAESADAVGTADQTGNGRLNLARAISDTSTTSVEPAGAAPVGGGGPFVGPYVVALAPSVTITFPVNGSRYSAAGWTAGCSTGATDDFCGTAARGGSATLSTTFYSLQRGAGSCWNGVSFSVACPNFVSTGATSPWSVSFPSSNLSDGSYTLIAEATQTGGTPTTNTTTVTFAIDKTAPTLTGAAVTASPTSSTALSFTITGDENITCSSLTSSDFSLTNANFVSSTQTSPTVCTEAITSTIGAGATGTTGVALSGSFGATDTAGNNQATVSSGIPMSWTVDRQAPTLAGAAVTTTPTSSTALSFTITGNENVTCSTLTSSDFTLANATFVSSTQTSPTVCTEAITSTQGTTTVALSGTFGATDTVGNTATTASGFPISWSIDLVAPTVTTFGLQAASDTGASSSDNLTNATTLTYDVKFSEAVTGLTSGSFSLGTQLGAASNCVVGTPSPAAGPAQNYTVSVAGCLDGTVILTLAANAVSDTATNPGPASAATAATVTIDQTPPSVDVEQDGLTDPTSTAPINFIATFSEPVIGFGSSGVSLSASTASGTLTGAVTEISPNNGTTYNIAVSGMTGPGDVVASVNAGAATDAAGNGNSASTSTDHTVTYSAPTVTINQPVTQTDPTNSSPIHFTVVFSAPVADFAGEDVTLSGTAGATTAIASETGPMDGTTYDVAVSGMTSDGKVVATLASGVAHDADGAATAASTSTDNVVTYDTTKPTVTVALQAASDTGVSNSDGITNAPTLIYNIVFSEPVSGLTASDFSLNSDTGCDIGTPNPSPGPATSYTVSLTSCIEGTVTLTLSADAVADASGNVGPIAAFTAATVTIDRTGPSVTINQKSTAPAQTDPTNSSPINFTAVFSEAVTGFSSGGVTITGTAGGTKIKTITGGPLTYNVAVSAMTTSGTVVASVNAGAASDIAGNANTASSNPIDATHPDGNPDNTVTWDVTRPSATVVLEAASDTGTSSIDNITNVDTLAYDATFSEPVTGLSSTSFTVTGTASGCVVGSPSGGPMAYAVSLTNCSEGTVILTLQANAATDAASNTGPTAAVVATTVTIDRTRPAVSSINTSGANPTNAVSINFAVTFSESVSAVCTPTTNYTTDFLIVTTGLVSGTSLGACSGTSPGTTRTIAVNTGSGNGTIGLNQTAMTGIIDVAGNALTGSRTGQTFTIDKTAPTATIGLQATSDKGLSSSDNLTNLQTLTYDVTFSEPVSGLTSGSFTGTGGTGCTKGTPSPSSGPASSYTITLTGCNAGSVTLTLSAGTVTDAAGNTGPTVAASAPAVTIDLTAPTVTSINRAASNPTNASSLSWTVTFGESVGGVDAADFALAKVNGSDPSAAVSGSITSVTPPGPGTPYTVTASVAGSGTVGLNLNDNDTITDVAGNMLGGTGTGTAGSGGAGNGSFIGQVYTIGVGSISGFVINDLDQDHSFSGGDGLASGITVCLSDANGVCVGQTATTDSLGRWTLGNLFAGTYDISYIVPTGWKNTGSADTGTYDPLSEICAGPLGDAQSPSSGHPAHVIIGLALGVGQTLGSTTPAPPITGVASYKFCTVQSNASISGTVYDDANANGVQDGGEKGHASVTVCIDSNGDGLCTAADLATTLTDANGKYTFSNLVANPFGVSYPLREVPPTGYMDTTFEGPEGPLPIRVHVDAGQSVTSGADFFIATSFVAGKVVNDQNANSLDDSEPGLGNAQICLYLDQAGAGFGTFGSEDIAAGTVGQCITTKSIPSSSAGRWVFGSVLSSPGGISYWVLETDPNGYGSTGSCVPGINPNYALNPSKCPAAADQFSSRVATASDITLSGIDPKNVLRVTLTTAVPSTSGNKFLDAEKDASISGVIYDDQNGNGKIDAGKNGTDYPLTWCGNPIVFQGEPACPSQSITLYADTNGNGIFDPGFSGDQVIGTSGTSSSNPAPAPGATGAFSFNGLYGGTYFAVQTGYRAHFGSTNTIPGGVEATKVDPKTLKSSWPQVSKAPGTRSSTKPAILL
ncbi:MAG TPA: SdrD B-like domain-containing protein [Candidatus Limnocylindrales bacterium]